MSDRLLALYAEREQAKGFQFLPNEKMHEDFARDFEYVETVDQQKAIDAVTLKTWKVKSQWIDLSVVMLVMVKQRSQCVHLKRFIVGRGKLLIWFLPTGTGKTTL